ncbi:MAG: ankyrin repeat domain-containing protein, partial [Burkholderiales bacterium]|nr:ankyrin repeat domain-containing protein [Burkholderiales bacterium]
NAYGNTALTCAIAKAHADVVQELLRHPEIDVNLSNSKGQTPLHIATLHAPQLLPVLLGHSSIDPTKEDANGDTPLFLAVKLHLPHVAVTIAGHHLSDSTDREGMTPLLMAIDAGDHDTVIALVDSGAIDPERGDDWRPLSRLLQCASPDSAGWRRSVLAFATSPRVLINAPEYTEADWTGNTLLHIAAKLNLPDVAAAIMARMDVAPHQANSFDQTALDIARQAGHDEIVHILLENFGHPNHFESDCKTAMYKAIEANDLDTVGALLRDDKFDPNFPCASRSVPLDVAMRLGRHEIVMLLLRSSRVDPDTPSRNRDGSAVIVASQRNFELGRYIAALEQVDRSDSGTVPNACSKDASFRLTLALEQALAKVDNWSGVREIANALLQLPERQLRTFNLNGVEYSRHMIEEWAAGRVNRHSPKDKVSEIEEAMTNNDGQNAHEAVWQDRGCNVYADIVARTPHDAKLTEKSALDGIRRAIHLGSLKLWKSRQTLRGLEEALSKSEYVIHTGLNTKLALTAMWGYITSRPSEQLRKNLVKSLFSCLATIGKERPCTAGCLLRILSVPEGIDPSLAPVQPDAATIRDEIASIAGMVNNRYESLYGDSALDLQSLNNACDEGSSSVGELTESEKAVISRYQAGMPIDENTVIELKQSMVKEAVIARLVHVQRWNPEHVGRELGPVLESMRYL